MNLFFDQSLGQNYRSPAQISRVLTENWLGKNAYCPNCGASPIAAFENNHPVGDFYCAVCFEQYELKSKNAFTIGKQINDGAYKTMIERITAEDNPNFFFLSYQKSDFSVQQLVLIPKHFFTTEMIVPRKPLAQSARRAGWVGCIIDLSIVPQSGKILLVDNAQVIPRAQVQQQWQEHLFLREQSHKQRGWLLAVMQLIERINAEEFSIQEMYAFEPLLQKQFPNNRNIQAKIRQQLQILRDRHVIEFTARGRYRKLIQR